MSEAPLIRVSICPPARSWEGSGSRSVGPAEYSHVTLTVSYTLFLLPLVVSFSKFGVFLATWNGSRQHICYYYLGLLLLLKNYYYIVNYYHYIGLCCYFIFIYFTYLFIYLFIFCWEGFEKVFFVRGAVVL